MRELPTPETVLRGYLKNLIFDSGVQLFMEGLFDSYSSTPSIMIALQRWAYAIYFYFL